MAPKPKPGADAASLVVRDLSKQFVSLERALGALDPAHAIAWAQSNLPETPSGYAGRIAVPSISNFGMFQIPATCEAWKKVTGWAMHTRIPGVNGQHASFDPKSFVLDERTNAAFERLNKQQSSAIKSTDREENRLRVFPVRFASGEDVTLARDEFFLDLSSLMWLMISHHPKWTQEPELLFRCLGEQYMKGGELLVGYRDLARVMQAVPQPAHQGIVVIGLAQ